MDNEISGDANRIIARERSHEEAKQTVATNRMLVQSLVLINGAAATAALVYYGARGASGSGKLVKRVITETAFFCLTVFPYSVSVEPRQPRSGGVIQAAFGRWKRSRLTRRLEAGLSPGIPRMAATSITTST